MTPSTLFVIAAVALGSFAVPALAQTAAPSMAAMPEAEMMGSMDKMSKEMAAVPMTGDADREFVGMMIPHHRGAVDMAHFELAHGKDPAMRALARGIIESQEKEIGQMHRWQAKHPQ